MEEYTTHIKAKNGWFDIRIKELMQYKDLIWLFVKRNFAVQYKQTILGPLWFIISPLLTTVMHTFIFGNIAGISTDGVPQFLFYLTSNAIWIYFSTCLNQTSNTFVTNASIFGKVYFPRLTMPISIVIFSLVNFIVIFIMDAITIFVCMIRGEAIHPNIMILLLPFLIIQTAALGLGFGIIISSLTTKYRDLTILVSFGVQLWMYATPVVYPLAGISGKLRILLLLNPVTPIINNFRYALLGCGEFELTYWLISIATTTIVLLFGILLFNKIEKTFMDTV